MATLHQVSNRFEKDADISVNNLSFEHYHLLEVNLAVS
jgi:hypothetical protein